MSPLPAYLLSTQTDARLIGLARRGYERAFEALVQRYQRQLLGYCRRMLLSEARAEDALQQALLDAWMALQRGHDVRNPKSWLYRIVHNSAVDALARSGYDYSELSETLHGADAPEADLERRTAVREALVGVAALPELQREALMRTAVQGHSHEEVALQLGVSDGTVRGLVYRARATLRTAATALTPAPLIDWAARGGARSAPLAERLCELSAAGGGSAGVSALILKGGTLAVTAGALATSIAVVAPPHAAAHRHRPAPRATPAAAIATTRVPSSAGAGPILIATDAGHTSASRVRVSRRTAANRSGMSRHGHQTLLANALAGRDGLQGAPTDGGGHGSSDGREEGSGDGQSGSSTVSHSRGSLKGSGTEDGGGSATGTRSSGSGDQQHGEASTDGGLGEPGGQSGSSGSGDQQHSEATEAPSADSGSGADATANTGAGGHGGGDAVSGTSSSPSEPSGG
jgi:RNA polymerase sigma factor (sigma-70 family)